MSKKTHIPRLTANQLNAIVNRIGGRDEVLRFLRHELSVSEYTSRWHKENDGVIYFSVTSTGKTGKEWIRCLESRHFCVSDGAKSVLRSSDFKPTKKGITTRIAVLNSVLLRSDADCVPKKILAEAKKRKLRKPNAELACLIRWNFTDEEVFNMGLWCIVTMHQPINNSYGNQGLLSVGRSEDGRWLDVCCDGPLSWWPRGSGFAFVVTSTTATPSVDESIGLQR